MARIVKFYFSDGKMLPLTNDSNNESFRLYVGQKIAKYGDIFKGYNTKPDTLILRDFYEQNLVNKEIVKVEFCEDDLVLSEIKALDDRVVKIYWEVGKIRSGDELIQERISIWEYFVNDNSGNKSL